MHPTQYSLPTDSLDSLFSQKPTGLLKQLNTLGSQFVATFQIRTDFFVSVSSAITARTFELCSEKGMQRELFFLYSFFHIAPTDLVLLCDWLIPLPRDFESKGKEDGRSPLFSKLVDTILDEGMLRITVNVNQYIPQNSSRVFRGRILTAADEVHEIC